MNASSSTIDAVESRLLVAADGGPNLRVSWLSSAVTQRWREPNGRAATTRVVVTKALLLGLLAAAEQPWLYLLWAFAWLTTYSMVTRIRSIAEHALTRSRNRRNTR